MKKSDFFQKFEAGNLEKADLFQKLNSLKISRKSLKLQSSFYFSKSGSFADSIVKSFFFFPIDSNFIHYEIFSNSSNNYSISRLRFIAITFYRDYVLSRLHWLFLFFIWKNKTKKKINQVYFTCVSYNVFTFELTF